MKEYGIKVGVLTALVSPEHFSAKGALKSFGWTESASEVIEKRANIRTWQKAHKGGKLTIKTAAIGGMGQAESAIETLAFLSRTNVHILFLCGIAGSLDEEKYKKEDVVVAKTVSWHGFNRLHDGELFDCFRLKSFDVPTPPRDYQTWKEEYFSNILDVRKRDKFSLHYEDIFTWDFVTHGQRATKKVVDICNSAACVEMEAGGFLASASRFAEINDARIPTFVVRGISDYTIKKDKDNRVRLRASENAVSVAVEMAEDFLIKFPEEIKPWL